MLLSPPLTRQTLQALSTTAEVCIPAHPILRLGPLRGLAQDGSHSTCDTHHHHQGTQMMKSEGQQQFGSIATAAHRYAQALPFGAHHTYMYQNVQHLHVEEALPQED